MSEIAQMKPVGEEAADTETVPHNIEAEQQLRQAQQKKESPVLFWAILIALVVVLGIASVYLLKNYV